MRASNEGEKVMNDTERQLDAKLFVTTVIDKLKDGILDTEDAVNEICFYMAHAKGHSLASFLRQIVVKKMDGVSFEKFIALMFSLRGYKVEFTPSTADQGVDLIAVRNQERIAIQCKRWDDPVGPEAVQEVFTGKSLYDCTKGILVTTASLTPQAQKMANKLDITYWDKDSIEALCEECVKKWDDATDIIQRFVSNKKLPVQDKFSSQDTTKVLEKIRKKRIIPHQVLQRRCWRFADAAKLKAIIRELEQQGKIRTSWSERRGKKRGQIYTYTGD